MTRLSWQSYIWFYGKRSGFCDKESAKGRELTEPPHIWPPAQLGQHDVNRAAGGAPQRFLPVCTKHLGSLRLGIKMISTPKALWSDCKVAFVGPARRIRKSFSYMHACTHTNISWVIFCLKYIIGHRVMIDLFVRWHFSYSLEHLFSIDDRAIYFKRGCNGVSFKGGFLCLLRSGLDENMVSTELLELRRRQLCPETSRVPAEIVWCSIPICCYFLMSLAMFDCFQSGWARCRDLREWSTQNLTESQRGLMLSSTKAWRNMKIELMVELYS